MAETARSATRDLIPVGWWWGRLPAGLQWDSTKGRLSAGTGAEGRAISRQVGIPAEAAIGARFKADPGAAQSPAGCAAGRMTTSWRPMALSPGLSNPSVAVVGDHV